MTLSTLVNKIIHLGNDVATEFSYNFIIPEESNLVVILTDDAGNETTLTSADYDVSGIGESSGGVVTYPKPVEEGEEELPPLPTGYKITILRDMALTQETDFENYQAFLPEVVEERLDIITMQIQQLQEQADRSVKIDITSSDTPDALMDEIYEDVGAAGASATAAQEAQAGAELAQSGAQGFATAAGIQAGYAEGFANAASDFSDEAKGYRDSASGYKDKAESAKDDAVIAQGKAEDAQGLAESAKDDAVIAQGKAESAKDDASGFASDAEGFKNDASGFADNASGFATKAQGYASDAQGYAEDTEDYYNAITLNGLVKVRNATGTTITAKIVKVVGDYATDEVPTVSAITSFTDRAIAYVDSLATDTTGDMYKSGRVVCTGFDCSGATDGDKVYCDETGSLTLTPTALEVGIVADNTENGVVFFNIGGAGGGSYISGEHKRLAVMDIDGTTNEINTNKALYTVGAGEYIKSAKLVICNRNGGYTAKVRVAHIDGAIGDIADEDYIIYDDYLLPYETKIIDVDGVVASDTFLVRSNITNVNFILTGEVFTTDIGIGRVGAIEIDGTTNTVDTDYEVFTATEAGKYNILICNRSAGGVVEAQIAIIDSDDIANIADEDRFFFSLDVLQTIFIEGEFNLAVDEMIAFRSNTADVNCIVYRVE